MLFLKYEALLLNYLLTIKGINSSSHIVTVFFI